ncbi:hypothetical protein [Haloferax volcanii]|uniref:hypothetical protein n=1 Tax=Haloferax volcanii TaxID=2246 RepID=UPI003D3025D4
MPGRPPWSTPGTRDGNERVASEITTFKQLDTKRKTYNQTGDVAIGEEESVQIYAPSGAIWRVVGVSVHIYPPENSSGTAATSGDHTLYFRNLGGEWYEAALEGKSHYDSPLRLANGNWYNADKKQKPNDGGAQLAQMRSFRLTSDDPLTVSYRNDTDVTQTQTRNIALAVIEEMVE